MVAITFRVANKLECLMSAKMFVGENTPSMNHPPFIFKPYCSN